VLQDSPRGTFKQVYAGDLHKCWPKPAYKEGADKKHRLDKVIATIIFFIAFSDDHCFHIYDFILIALVQYLFKVSNFPGELDEK